MKDLGRERPEGRTPETTQVVGLAERAGGRRTSVAPMTSRERIDR
jgi:hypothetical protein